MTTLTELAEDMPQVKDVPSAWEYQDPTVSVRALWAADPDGWLRQATSLADRARRLQPRVVFLGDSITQGWGAEGADEWSARFAPLPAANLGIGGDRTQNLLWRVAHGALEGTSPELAVILIGVNNLWQDVRWCGTRRVAEGVAAAVDGVRAACPGALALALGVLPTQFDPHHPLRAVVRDVNAASAAALASHAGAVRFADVGGHFLEADGSISPDVMHDGCHLTVRGYRLFADALEPLVTEMLRS